VLLSLSKGIREKELEKRGEQNGLQHQFWGAEWFATTVISKIPILFFYV
jgi:hypothetical protein